MQNLASAGFSVPHSPHAIGAPIACSMWDALLQLVKFWAMAVDETCPVCRTAEIVCGKWTLLLVRDLAEGRSRFCELERSLQGISPRTLSLRLRALEEEGIVERHTYPEVPPRVEYALTEKGRALLPLIDDMRTYGTLWLGADCASDVEAPTVVAAA
jgi:DNA-binding HxlR family transcriptional regulator